MALDKWCLATPVVGTPRSLQAPLAHCRRPSLTPLGEKCVGEELIDTGDISNFAKMAALQVKCKCEEGKAVWADSKAHQRPPPPQPRLADRKKVGGGGGSGGGGDGGSNGGGGGSGGDNGGGSDDASTGVGKYMLERMRESDENPVLRRELLQRVQRHHAVVRLREEGRDQASPIYSYPLWAAGGNPEDTSAPRLY